jgi:benzoyl-CoA reductase/2-hydroxyglutaryl-CoA dehydratase subunit BcrC/BadD/HgdB
MLMEVLRLKGIEAIPFAFPQQPDLVQIEASLISLAQTLGTSLEAAEEIRQKLIPTRRLAAELDRLTWQEGLVTGQQNHYWLVNSSDFAGNPEKYRKELQSAIEDCRKRQSYRPDMLRLAYIGVPAIYGRHLYKYLEENEALVVLNEIQRQFSMPGESQNLAEQYCNYTYPYSTEERIKDIAFEIKKRRVNAVIHYVQAFCHRAISDILFREALDIPILTIEGNNSFFLSQHLITRIEAFLDILKQRIKRSKYSHNTVGNNIKKEVP